MGFFFRLFLASIARMSGTRLGFFFQKISYAVYRQSCNPGYKFYQNGELNLIDKLAGEMPSCNIVDVGANVGHWSIACAQKFGSQSVIFAFEPGDLTFKKLESATKMMVNIVPLQVGFSDTNCSLNLVVNCRASEKSSVEQVNLTELAVPAASYQTESHDFVRGDEFFKGRGLRRINFLKIDTEGHDIKVLKGFSEMISDGRVDVIQFEYNRLNIVVKAMLLDFYRLLNVELTTNGYAIGRIYPKGVHFKSYQPSDENFIDGNIVAIRLELKALIDQLRC